MDGDFQVELDQLSGLIHRLDTAHERMSAALSTLSNADTSETGSTTLSSACEDVHNTWKYGLKLLAKATGGITDKLTATEKAYSDTDDQVGSLFQKIAGAIGGGI